MKILAVCLGLFCSFSLLSQSAQLPLRQYSVNNGLITNNVYSIFKDSNGLLWFGTENGVLQYDGTEFIAFSTSDGLPDNEIFNFCEDVLGRIWFSTFNGNLGYYFQGNLYNAANTDFLDMGNHAAYISLMENQKDSSMLILFYQSNFALEVKGTTIKKHTFNFDIAQFNNIQYIAKAGDQRFTAITISHELVFDGDKLVSAKRLPGLNRVYFSNKNYLLRDDSLFTLTQANLDFICTLKNTALVYNTFYYEAGLGVLGGSQGGLNDFTEPDAFHLGNILPDCNVSGINKDTEGNFWFTTLNKGVFFLPKGYENIHYAKYPSIDKINTFIPMKNRLFLYTEDKKIFVTDNQMGNLSPYLDYSAKMAVSSSKRTKLRIYQTENEIILGGDELFGFSKSKGLKRIKFEKDFYSKDIQISGDTIFSSNNSSVNISLRREPVSKNLMVYPDDQTRIFDITYNDQKLWVSTLKSIYTLQKESLVKHPAFENIAFKKFNFYNNTLVGITHDYKLVVAVPVKGSSDYKIQWLDEKVFWIDMNYVFNQRVLLRSDRGYYLLDLSGEKASLSPTENSLLPNFPHEIACDSPFVYFLSVDNEITKIHYSLIKVTPSPPVLLIKSFTADNNHLNFQEAFTLEYSDAKRIEIIFTGIGFARKKILYQYRLNNGNWIDVDKNTLNLLNMAPGKYHISIRCKSDSSEFSDFKSIDFTILPPWYNHWAFRALILFLGLSAGYFFLRNTLKKREKEKELKHQQELKFIQSEFKSLNALMNPHFIFNCLNNIQYLINDDKKLEANQYLGIFSRLIRQNMENISNNLISLEKELNLVKNYLELEKLRFDKAIQYQISIDESLDIAAISVPPLLIQPLVENAIKHGILPTNKANGKLHIRIRKEEKNIVISVEDNGRGLGQVAENPGLRHSINNITTRFKHLEKMRLQGFILEIKNITDRRGAITGTQAIITITEKENRFAG